MAYYDPYTDWLQQSGWGGWFGDPNTTTPSATGAKSLYSDLLDENPEMAYYAQLEGPQGRDLTPNQRLYLQSPAAYGKAQNQYYGQLGASLQAGQLPSTSFSDYLAQRPITERYLQLLPELRNRPGASFGPPRRYR